MQVVFGPKNLSRMTNSSKVHKLCIQEPMYRLFNQFESCISFQGSCKWLYQRKTLLGFGGLHKWDFRKVRGIMVVLFYHEENTCLILYVIMVETDCLIKIYYFYLTIACKSNVRRLKVNKKVL